MSDCYCIILRNASRKVTALYDTALEPFGITLAQFSLLRRIKWRAPISITELAHLAELDRSTMGRNVKVLERRGLVQTVAGNDQREAVLALTDAGRQVLIDAGPTWDSVQAGIETRLGPGGVAQLHQLLEAL